MVETRSGLNTSATSSSESGTMPKEATQSPLSPSTRTVESATGEREELRKRIQKLSKMASLRRPINMSIQECDLLGDALLELDEFLEDEEQSAHYNMLGSLRDYLVQRDQAASAAAIAAICPQATPSTVTSSAAEQHPPLHSTLMPPGYGWPLLGSLASSLSTAASSTTTTSAAGAPRLSNVFSNTGVFNQTPLLGTTLPMPPQFTSQPAFSGQLTGQSGLSGFSMRRFPTTVKKDDIPRFDGRPSSWSRFKERFISVVGENPNLKEIDKLDHLATAIPSSAKTVLSFANWDQALTDLELEYADPDEVINDLLHLASDVKPLGAQARGTEWKVFREEIKNIIRLSEHHDPTLQRSLHTALALKLGEHRMEYIRQFGGKTLAQLNAYVGKELEAYRIAEHHEATAWASASLPVSLSTAGRTGTPEPTPNQVHPVGAPARQMSPCFFCDGDHFRRECPLDRQQRTDGLHARNRCVRCLAKLSNPAHPTACQEVCRRCCTNALHSLICGCPTSWTTSVESRTHPTSPPAAPTPIPEPPVHTSRTIAHVSTGKPSNRNTGCSYMEPEEDSFSDGDLTRLFGVYHVSGTVFEEPFLSSLAAQPIEPTTYRDLCQDRPTVLRNLPSYDPDTNRSPAGPPWPASQRPAATEASHALGLQRLKSEGSGLKARWQPADRRIQASTSPAQWYFIPGKVNPADLTSQGALIRRLSSRDLWAYGPSLEDISGVQQPTALPSCEPPLVNSISQPAPDDYAQALIDNNNYSRLRSALSVLLQLADRKLHVLRAYQQHYGQDVDLALLTDILLWRLIQKATLLPELQSIRSGLPMPPSSPPVKVPLALDRCSLSVYLPGCSRAISQVVATGLRRRRLRIAKPYSASMAPLPEDRVNRSAGGTVLPTGHLLLGRRLQSPAPVKRLLAPEEDTLLEYSRFQSIEGIPRYVWERGRIYQLPHGKGNHIRALPIELLSGGTGPRKSQRVYPSEHPTYLSPGEDVAVQYRHQAANCEAAARARTSTQRHLAHATLAPLLAP